MTGSSINMLNGLGSHFCHWAPAMLIQSSILIALLLAADLLLRKRLRATVRYCIWMLVFVKLVLPPTFHLPTGIGQWLGRHLPPDPTVMRMSHSAPIDSAVDPIIVTPPADSVEFAAPVVSRAPETLTQNASAPAPETPRLPGLTWQGLLLLAWLAGVLLLVAFVIKRVLMIRGYVIRSRPAKGLVIQLLNECRAQLRIHRTVELRITPKDTSPAAYGLLRPRILLSASALSRLSGDRLRTILIHELAHIKRGDLWVNLAQSMLQVIYFYNPLLWLANTVVRRVREQAVDEMVLVSLGNEPEDYSSTLVDIAELAFPRPSLGLQLIGVVESRKALAQRVKHIMTRPVPRTAKLGVIGLAALVLIAAVLLPMAGAAPNEANTNADAAEEQRVRELVYVLRNSVVFSRADQWASAIQELKEIGEAAVPELAAELDRTERNATIRMLAFALRAIDDPRAVPALIRALPKSVATGSDCMLPVSDPNLWQFIARHQIGGQDRQRPSARGLYFGIGRPVREVTSALEKITGHSEGHEHYHAHDSNDKKISAHVYETTPEIVARQKDYRQAAAERWQAWWDEHWSEFVSEEEIIPPAADGQEDLVEGAGVARFGVPFPSGKGVKLGPVTELLVPPETFRDAKAFLDLETGRQFFNRQGALPQNRFDFAKWCTQVGVDVWVSRSRYEGKPLFKLYGWNMHTWQIENSRWDSFENEVASASRIELPTEGPRDDFRNIDPATDEYHHRKRPVTFLFTTVSGGSGIIQIDGPTDDPNGVLIRYRMIVKPDYAAGSERHEPVIYRPELGGVGYFGPVIERVVGWAASDSDSALDMDTGQLSVPPAEIRYPPLSKELSAWLEDKGMDVIAVSSPGEKLSTLTTFDMKAVYVSAASWNSITPRETAEMLWLTERKESSRMRWHGSSPETYPMFFLFQTREGGQGLIEIAGPAEYPQGIRIRYRILEK
ncbi:MAG: M56 family metallopeptidase [Planctomycetota bacterium]|jgi:beta-lactamase regulating signal transducer with metallopeptidase domain